MPTFTGTADSNGDFTIHFLSNYTGGQEVSVTAEKDGETNTIKLYAPSANTGNVIVFTGPMVDFPNDIGGVVVGEWVRGSIPGHFMSGFQADSIWRYATSLELSGDITSIAAYAFRNWISCKKLVLPSTIVSIGIESFGAYIACEEIIIHAETPPTILASTFQMLKSTCIFKVPATSVPMYQAAANWSSFASRIQAI